MYPVGGPTKATTSDAERLIYDLLSRSLDDTYHVFHSVSLAIKEEDGRIVNGEIDFIIVHPDEGILLFGVKGGGVHPAFGRTVFHLASTVNIPLFEAELAAFAQEVGASPTQQSVLVLD